MARILVLQNMYPPHHFGGYELSCRDTVERWRERGHEVSVLTSTMRLAGVEDPPGERSNGTWRDLNIAYRDADLWSPPFSQRLGRERADQTRLSAAIADARPEVVSLWHMGALSTGIITTLVRSGLPLVYVVCDDWLTYAARIDPWMRWFLGRPRLGGAVERLARVPATVPDVGASGAFCFVSDLTRRRSIEHTDWTFPIATVTYSGIDERDFPVTTAPAKAVWRWRLLHVGRLDPRKGIETAVRALANLPREATLDLLGAGDDSYRDELEGVARGLGVGERLRFGSVPRDQLRERYEDADAVLFPTDWEEPFGLVPIEAMACGTPVVATGRGGSAEFLVDGANCVQFPAGDPVALAAAVDRLADDAALRARLVQFGKHTAAELTASRLADVLEEWHLAAAERFRSGQPAQRPSMAELVGRQPPA
ncbi:MAG: glycogen synthase [Actinomycetota bacterium]|jgi:glycosyltransferase involved in cell wall biosynthesis